MKLTKTLLFSVCLALASPLHAADDDTKKEDKEDRYDPTYSAIRITSVSTDFDNIDRAVNLGFTLGIHIPGVDFLSAEIDISSTLIPGENKGTGPIIGGDGGSDDGGLLGGLLGGGDGGGGSDGGSSTANNSNSGEDLRMNSVGIFAAGRTPGKFFGSARIGYRFMETSLSDLDEERTGSAWGLGMGYRYGKSDGTVELTYTQYGSKVSFIAFSVSY